MRRGGAVEEFQDVEYTDTGGGILKSELPVRECVTTNDKIKRSKGEWKLVHNEIQVILDGLYRHQDDGFDVSKAGNS